MHPSVFTSKEWLSLQKLVLLQTSPPSLRLSHASVVAREKKRGGKRECFVGLDQQRGGGEET